jgi:hypothetical protein
MHLVIGTPQTKVARVLPANLVEAEVPTSMSPTNVGRMGTVLGSMDLTLAETRTSEADDVVPAPMVSPLIT